MNKLAIRNLVILIFFILLVPTAFFFGISFMTKKKCLECQNEAQNCAKCSKTIFAKNNKIILVLSIVAFCLVCVAIFLPNILKQNNTSSTSTSTTKVTKQEGFWKSIVSKFSAGAPAIVNESENPISETGVIPPSIVNESGKPISETAIGFIPASGVKESGEIKLHSRQQLVPTNEEDLERRGVNIENIAVQVPEPVQVPGQAQVPTPEPVLGQAVELTDTRHMQIFKEQSDTDANPVSQQGEVIPAPRQADVEPGQAQQPIPPLVPPPLPETEPPPVPTPEAAQVPTPTPEPVSLPVPEAAQVPNPGPAPEPTPGPIARTPPPVPPPIEQTYPPQKEKPPLVPNLVLNPVVYALQGSQQSNRVIDNLNPATNINDDPIYNLKTPKQNLNNEPE